MDVQADVGHLAGVLPFAAIIPFPDLLFGAALLVVVVLLHGVGIRLVATRFYRRSANIARHPHASVRLDVLLGVSIFLLLALHLAKIVLWIATLVCSKLVADWHVAAFFAANTCTTLGYGNFVLPAEWNMMAPIIAISGLFAFGWTGSVLVGFVAAVNRIRDRAQSLPDTARPRVKPNETGA
jgi:hypothetical protein